MTGSALTAVPGRLTITWSPTDVGNMSTSILKATSEVACPRGQTSLAIPASKFAPPLAPATHVRRPELVSRVCQATAGRVTLLRASTGCGKTTLMQACREELRQAGIATAWINLDASDNDAARMLQCLATALTRSIPAMRPAARGNPGAGFAAEAATDLLDRVGRSTGRFVIFLDDFEELHDAAALAWIAALIDHLPSCGGLVIASRRAPDLPLSRLRARGQLIEVDSTELRFSLQETDQLLNVRRGLALQASDIDQLQRCTEGWVAGLSLATVALERAEHRTAFIEGFSGSYSTVSEYLAECVLARQPEAVRRFLLRTSVLKQFNAHLCEALLPGVSARAMLEQIAAADIPLATLDGVGHWFRYHSMFAAFLQSVLEREAAQEIHQLHSRAARWYAAQQRPVPAIAHALQSGDPLYAVSLLRKHAHPLMQQGRTRLLERWFSALPVAIMKAEPRLQAMHLWATTYTLGAESASALLERYAIDDCDDASVRACIRPLKPLLLALMDKVEEAAEVGLRSVAERREASGFSDAVLSCTVAGVLANLGNYELAREQLELARRAEAGAVAGFTVMHCETTEAIIDAQEGRLRQAFAHLRLAVEASRRDDQVRSAGNAWAGVLHACAHYELGELDIAERLLRVHAPAIHAVGLADMMILIYRHLARIAFGRGDIDDAFQALSELEYLGHQRRLDRVIASAKLERSRLLLLQGHAEPALEELHRAGDDALWTRVARTRLVANEVDDLEIATLRWDAVAGDAAAASLGIEASMVRALAGRRRYRAFKLRLLQVVALVRCERLGEAQFAIGRLLRETSTEGFVQMFADEGQLVAAVVRQFAATGADQRSRVEPLFDSYLQRVLRALGVATDAQVEPVDTEPTEPLTRKELKVLHLVSEGLGDSAIADKLFLSLSTVRTHLRNIYAKLDVHSRMQAVLTARRVGWL